MPPLCFSKDLLPGVCTHYLSKNVNLQQNGLASKTTQSSRDLNKFKTQVFQWTGFFFHNTEHRMNPVAMQRDKQTYILDQSQR